MKTALKRIIAAVAVFGALSALCYSCTTVKVSAADAEIFSEAPENERELVEWCLEELNTTYQIYRTGPVPAAAIQKLQALLYASAVAVGKKAYSQYEPDFEGNLVGMRTGFYFDADGELHVTDIFASRNVSKQSKTQLAIASDEHFTTLGGYYDIGENGITGYSVQISGDNVGAMRFWTWQNNYKYYGYTIITNDTGDTFQFQGEGTIQFDLTNPATTCTRFPPYNYPNIGYVNYMGYLPITDENNNTVYLRNNALPVTDALLGSDLENVVNHINNYISENYPLSEVVVPVPEPIATLPNDEYSGLPAGWNEINPVPLPDIQTPSAPLTDAEMENAHEWLTDFSFWASVQSGLAFWFAAAAHVAEINETLTGILLGVSLLSVLGYVIWRWGV